MNTLANEKRYKACYLTKYNRYHDCIKPQWYVHTVLLICQPLVCIVGTKCYKTC